MTQCRLVNICRCFVGVLRFLPQVLIRGRTFLGALESVSSRRKRLAKFTTYPQENIFPASMVHRL
jgi:hypothetical protein